MKVYYSRDYVACAEAFDTTRKSAAIAESLQKRPIEGVSIESPEPLTVSQLQLAHSTDYIEAVRTGRPRSLAESNGFGWDEKMFCMVSYSNGGVVAAVAEALKSGVSGSFSSGLHHAGRHRGSGFCTFNGLAIAAINAIEKQMANRVLIIDFDAHYGDGTAEIIAGRDDIVMIDVSTGWNDGDYISECRDALQKVANDHFDVAIYNAGMDPHEDCRIGGRRGVTADVLDQCEKLVFEYCRDQRWPVAFTLAGGYAGGKLPSEAIVELHRLTIQAAANIAG